MLYTTLYYTLYIRCHILIKGILWKLKIQWKFLMNFEPGAAEWVMDDVFDSCGEMRRSIHNRITKWERIVEEVQTAKGNETKANEMKANEMWRCEMTNQRRKHISSGCKSRQGAEAKGAKGQMKSLDCRWKCMKGGGTAYRAGVWGMGCICAVCVWPFLLLLFMLLFMTFG